MNKIEAPSKYGLAADRKAELPANPAAKTKGRIGRQQLDAARTLAIAAILANVLRVPLYAAVSAEPVVVCSCIFIDPALLSRPLESSLLRAARLNTACRRSLSP
jgi:hypothetical protein